MLLLQEHVYSCILYANANSHHVYSIVLTLIIGKVIAQVDECVLECGRKVRVQSCIHYSRTMRALMFPIVPAYVLFAIRVHDTLNIRLNFLPFKDANAPLYRRVITKW